MAKDATSPPKSESNQPEGEESGARIRLNWFGRIVVGAVVLLVGAWLYMFFTARAARDRPPLPNPNGYDDFLAAADQLGSFSSRMLLTNDIPLFERVLATNGPALAAFRRGLARECRVPFGFTDQYLGRHVKDLGRIKEIARLVIAEAAVARAQGRPQEATTMALEVVHYGHQLTRGGVLIDDLVGAANIAIGLNDLRVNLDKMDAQTARRAAVRLLELDAGREPFTAIMKNERDLIRGLTPGLQGLFRRGATWLEARRAIRSVGHRHDQRRALLRMFAIELALHAHRLEKGSLPESLADMKPEFLEEIPNDPFTGGPFVYRITDSFELYSVGPDGVDDGGKAVARGEWDLRKPKGDVPTGVR